MVVDQPANEKKRPESRELKPQLKPLRPLEYVSGQPPRVAFKTKEKPLVELPKVGGNPGPPRLPSDLMLLDTPTIETRSQPPQLSAANLQKDDLDSLLRDITAA